ncbi:MAG: hypothetical protein WC860_08725 [Candidatus Margulisiibacteriota bacterium]|jgi:hypothetical protein
MSSINKITSATTEKPVTAEKSISKESQSVNKETVTKPIINANPTIVPKNILNDFSIIPTLNSQKTHEKKQNMPITPILPEKNWLTASENLFKPYEILTSTAYHKYSTPSIFDPRVRDSIIAISSLGIVTSAILAPVSITTGLVAAETAPMILSNWTMIPAYVGIGIALMALGYYAFKKYSFNQYDLADTLNKLKHHPDFNNEELINLESSILGLRKNIQYIIDNKMENEVLEKIQLPPGVKNLKGLIKSLDTQYSNLVFLLYKLYHKPQYLSDYEKKILNAVFPNKNIKKILLINRFRQIKGLDYQKVIDYFDAKIKTDPAAVEELELATKKLFSDEPRLLSTKERSLLEFLVNPDFIKYKAKEYKRKKGSIVQIDGTRYETKHGKTFEKVSRG